MDEASADVVDAAAAATTTASDRKRSRSRGGRGSGNSGGRGHDRNTGASAQGSPGQPPSGPTGAATTAADPAATTAPPPPAPTTYTGAQADEQEQDGGRRRRQSQPAPEKVRQAGTRRGAEPGIPSGSADRRNTRRQQKLQRMRRQQEAAAAGATAAAANQQQRQPQHQPPLATLLNLMDPRRWPAGNEPTLPPEVADWLDTVRGQVIMRSTDIANKSMGEVATLLQAQALSTRNALVQESRRHAADIQTLELLVAHMRTVEDERDRAVHEIRTTNPAWPLPTERPAPLVQALSAREAPVRAAGNPPSSQSPRSIVPGTGGPPSRP